MAEPKDEQIMAALATHLGGIVGDGGATYWHTTSAVLRPPGFTDACLDPDLPDGHAIYVIVPIPQTEADKRKDSCDIASVLSLDVAVLTRFSPSTEDPFDPILPLRVTVQARLARDAKKRLRGDVGSLGGEPGKLGGLAQFTDVPTTDYGADATYMQGWAVAFLSVQISYFYPRTT